MRKLHLKTILDYTFLSKVKIRPCKVSVDLRQKNKP